MAGKRWVKVAILVIASCTVVSARRAMSQLPEQSVIRLAELEIDPGQLPAYTAALKDEIETSIRIEPGVLKLYAVALKDHPNQIRLFECYRDLDAYQSHLLTPHFMKYKTRTQKMVKSLTLIETEPIALGSKP